MLSARQLFLRMRGLICARHNTSVNHRLETLALLVSGLILGRSAQVWEIALWIPWDINLLSFWIVPKSGRAAALCWPRWPITRPCCRWAGRVFGARKAMSPASSRRRS